MVHVHEAMGLFYPALNLLSLNFPPNLQDDELILVVITQPRRPIHSWMELHETQILAAGNFLHEMQE